MCNAAYHSLVRGTRISLWELTGDTYRVVCFQRAQSGSYLAHHTRSTRTKRNVMADFSCVRRTFETGQQARNGILRVRTAMPAE